MNTVTMNTLTMSPVIRTENLVKKFRRVEALNGLNLEVPPGAIYALVGPNGAGKTTAIKILMNIFGATSGHAEVLGMDTKQIAGKALTSIGYVSENQQLPDWMRVDAFFAYLRPFYPSWDRDLENQLVRQLALPLDRKLSELSRGMRMKATLASSLAYRPRLVVLDEPFSGLDPLVRDELIEGMLERAEEATIFISSHDLRKSKIWRATWVTWSRGGCGSRKKCRRWSSASVKWRSHSMLRPRCPSSFRPAGCGLVPPQRWCSSLKAASTRSGRTPRFGT